MSLTKLTDLDSTEFKRNLEIYQTSFPSNETRPSDLQYASV